MGLSRQMMAARDLPDPALDRCAAVCAEHACQVHWSPTTVCACQLRLFDVKFSEQVLQLCLQFCSPTASISVCEPLLIR